MKLTTDRKRKEQEFQVGEKVRLKLQPYAQLSLVNMPFSQLSFKYFGSYEVGKAAYRQDLPEESMIHPVFHVSQLKSFLPDFTLVFSTLPVIADLNKESLALEAVIDRRLVKKGGKAISQALIKWTALPDEAATWEDWYVLQGRFPRALARGPASFGGGKLSRLGFGVHRPPLRNAIALVFLTSVAICPGHGLYHAVVWWMVVPSSCELFRTYSGWLLFPGS